MTVSVVVAFFVAGSLVVVFYTLWQRQARHSAKLQQYIDSMPNRDRIEYASAVFIDNRTGAPWVYDGLHAQDTEYKAYVKAIALLIRRQDAEFERMVVDKALAISQE